MHITVGADPELFLRDNAGNFISAHGMVSGTKKKPFPVTSGAVQIDGTALEFNINPANTRQEFIGNITDVMDQMRKMVPGFNFAIEPTAIFERKYFDALPESAKLLGCDPDFDPYDMEVNPQPRTAEPMRTAGGHIHLGWLTEDKFVDPEDPNHFADCALVAKEMDYYLGLGSTYWDKDGRRRKLYGRAGAFRPKPFGVEYRALSNAWLKSEMLMGWVYDAAQVGMRNLIAGRSMYKNWGDKAREIINQDLQNWALAFAPWDEMGILPPPILNI